MEEKYSSSQIQSLSNINNHGDTGKKSSYIRSCNQISPCSTSNRGNNSVVAKTSNPPPMPLSELLLEAERQQEIESRRLPPKSKFIEEEEENFYISSNEHLYEKVREENFNRPRLSAEATLILNSRSGDSHKVSNGPKRIRVDSWPSPSTSYGYDSLGKVLRSNDEDVDAKLQREGVNVSNPTRNYLHFSNLIGNAASKDGDDMRRKALNQRQHSRVLKHSQSPFEKIPPIPTTKATWTNSSRHNSNDTPKTTIRKGKYEILYKGTYV